MYAPQTKIKRRNRIPIQVLALTLLAGLVIEPALAEETKSPAQLRREARFAKRARAAAKRDELSKRADKRAPGEYIIRVSRATVQQAGGSFIRHEKDYERTLFLRSATGDLDPLRIPRGEGEEDIEVPLHVYKSTFIPDDPSALDVEVHLNPYFSAGFKLSHHSLISRRQESVTFSSDERTFLEPFPTESTALKLNAAMFQTSLHAPVGGSFDPYLSLRSGAVAYTGESHEFLVGDPYRIDNTIPNGRGYVVEGAAGFNLYLNPYMGMSLETGYSNYVLSSDLFQNRVYGISYLSLGIFVANVETGLN